MLAAAVVIFICAGSVHVKDCNETTALQTIQLSEDRRNGFGKMSERDGVGSPNGDPASRRGRIYKVAMPDRSP